MIISLKILVPCDGSKPSVNALAKALELFRHRGETDCSIQTHIILLYSVPPIETPFPIDENGMAVALPAQTNEYIRLLYASLRDRAFDTLQTLSKSIDRNRFDVGIEILYGNPADKIIEYAHKEDVDAIVMGNVGLSGLSKLKVLGSVSRNVSERAEVPVVIVPYLQ